MKDLDPRAQALFDSVRDADGLTARDKARVKRRVLGRVAAATLAASIGTASTTTAASVARAGWAVSMTKLAVVGIASVLVVGGVVASRQRAASLRDQNAAVHIAAQAPAVGSVKAEFTAVLVPPPAPVAESALASRVSPRPLAVARGTLATVETKESTETLEQELPLLQRAQAALRSGDAERALHLLDLHAKRFPDGTLAEERRAAHAIAACRAGWPSARAEANAFVRDVPASPMVDRVNQECSRPTTTH